MDNLRAPPAPLPPNLPQKTPEEQRQQDRLRQLRMSYGHTFSGVHGKAVLDDLKARFGWDGDIERPSYRPGQSFDMTASADSMKEPVRHILAMIRPPEDKPEHKPTTATSA